MYIWHAQWWYQFSRFRDSIFSGKENVFAEIVIDCKYIKTICFKMLMILWMEFLHLYIFLVRRFSDTQRREVHMIDLCLKIYTRYRTTVHQIAFIDVDSEALNENFKTWMYVKISKCRMDFNVVDGRLTRCS